MNKRRIVIPDGMLKAAAEAFAEKCTKILGVSIGTFEWTHEAQVFEAVEAALLWLSENAIIPSDEVIKEIQDHAFANIFGSKEQLRYAMMQWQIRMFLAAPEPELPDEVKNLFISQQNEHTREFNDRIIEAYRLGKKSRDLR